MNIELKPCPFCGGEAEMMGDQYPYVECQECAGGFTANHSYDADEGDAANKWNARSAAGDSARAQGGQGAEVVALTGRIHELKTDPTVFSESMSGRKPWEIRKNDRDYRAGDTVVLRETTKTGAEIAAGAQLQFTGRTATGVISFVLDGPAYGLSDGWCIFSLYTQPHPAVPEGWLVRRVDDRITVQHPDIGGYCASKDGNDHSAIAPVILYHLASALLSTPITPQADGCPECGSTDLSWHTQSSVTNGTPDGKLRASEVSTLFVLGCGHCSETIKTLTADQVAENMSPQPPAGQEGA